MERVLKCRASSAPLQLPWLVHYSAASLSHTPGDAPSNLHTISIRWLYMYSAKNGKKDPQIHEDIPLIRTLHPWRDTWCCLRMSIVWYGCKMRVGKGRHTYCCCLYYTYPSHLPCCWLAVVSLSRQSRLPDQGWGQARWGGGFDEKHLCCTCVSMQN